jgi:hypothetical protein
LCSRASAAANSRTHLRCVPLRSCRQPVSAPSFYMKPRSSVQAAGAKVTSSVSGKTTLLVCKDADATTTQKAQEVRFQFSSLQIYWYSDRHVLVLSVGAGSWHYPSDTR